MKCTAYIDPKTGIALEGEALVNASQNPDAPRCGNELVDDDRFCPACGRRKTHTDCVRRTTHAVVELPDHVTGTPLSNPICCKPKNFFTAWLSFSGRISRKEFGQKVGVLLIVVGLIFFIGAICAAITGGTHHCYDFWRGSRRGTMVTCCVSISLLITGLSFLSVLTRRIHDHGMSAWNLLFGMIVSVILIPIYWICLGCCQGDLMANKYGVCPTGNGAGVSEKDARSTFPEVSSTLLNISIVLNLIVSFIALR